MAINKINRVVLSNDVLTELDAKATKVELNNAKTDIENKINAVVQGFDYKEAVNTFADLATTYPNAEDGWTVAVKDIKKPTTYKYINGEWIDIGLTSTPRVSNLTDGLMLKEDKVKLDGVQANAQVNLTTTQMLAELKKVDGAGSGLDADLLDGKDSTDFANATHDHSGVYNTKTEITTMLNGKSNINHKHVSSEITDLHTHPNKTILDKLEESVSNPNYDLSKFVTQTDLGNAGYGDMVKSTYDTNGNGKVDNAEVADSVPWSGVTGKPSTFTPSTHSHSEDLLQKNPLTGSAFYVNRDVVGFNHSASITGTLKITLPTRSGNTMLRIEIDGYSFSTAMAWKLIIGGYTSTTNWSSINVNLFGKAPFNTIRFGNDGVKDCILLGTTSTQWSYPKIAVSNVFSGHGSTGSYSTGWSMEVITDETTISVINTPNIVAFANQPVIQSSIPSPTYSYKGDVWFDIS